MKNVYRTAQGKAVDLDSLRVAHEETIAVGNMKTNARGDELGPGGVVVRTRNEVVGEYYQNNAVYTKERVDDMTRETQRARSGGTTTVEFPSDMPADILEQDQQMDEVIEEKPALRGSLADAVAKTAKVEQKLLTPKRPNGNGPSRM